MAKRFVDTDKFRKPFIRGLQGAYKLLWDYLCCDCDHAGIWIVDFEITQIYIGADMLVNKNDALKYFNEDEERIIEIDNGRKWFIKPFVEFQYGGLNPENRVHKSVLNVLSKYDLYKSDKGLVSPLKGCKDKDKDKDKDKVKDKGDLQKINGRHFSEFWDDLPSKMKIGKAKAEKSFVVSVKTLDDYQKIKHALQNYLVSERVKNGYVQNASTWFHNWRDWVEYSEVGSELAQEDEIKWKNIRRNIEKILSSGRSVDDAIKQSRVVERWHPRIRKEFTVGQKR